MFTHAPAHPPNASTKLASPDATGRNVVDAGHVTLVVSNYPPEIGSAARLFAELSDGLVKRGFKVTVVTTHPRSGYAKSAPVPAPKPGGQDQNPRIVRVRTLTAPQGNVYGRALEHFALSLTLPWRALSCPRGVFLVYSPPLPLAAAVVFVSGLRRDKSIVNVQDLYPQTAIDAGMLKPGIVARLFTGMAKWVYRNATVLVTHSKGNAEWVTSEGPRGARVKVVHNWADLSVERKSILSGTPRPLARTREFSVVYAGIMSYHQDLGSVIRAASLLGSEMPVRFTLVGDGPERIPLIELARALSANNVEFQHAKASTEYAEVLRSADAAIVSLRKEVTTPVVPSKLLDIMASGVACIAVVPPSSDAAEIVRETGCGIVVEPGRPDHIADAIRHLTSSPAEVRKMGESGREAYKASFSFDSALESYAQLIGEITNGVV